MNTKYRTHKGQLYLSFNFDGIDSWDMGVFSVSSGSTYTTEVLSSFTDNSLTVDGYNGKYYFNTQTTEKQFQLTCFIDNLSYQEYQQVRAWIQQNKIGKLILPESPFKYYWAKVSSVGTLGNIPLTHPVNGGMSYTGTFTLTFATIGQPVAYGMFSYRDDLKYYEYGDIYSIDDDYLYDSGLLYLEESLPMNKRLGKGQSNMGMYNPGTYKARPIVTIVPRDTIDFGTLTITNEDTGDVATITLKDMLANDILIIDFEKNEYSLNKGDTKTLTPELFNGDLLTLRPDGFTERINDTTIEANEDGVSTNIILDKTVRQVRKTDIDKYVSFKNAIDADATYGVGGKIIGIDSDRNMFIVETEQSYSNPNANIVITKADTIRQDADLPNDVEIEITYEIHPRYM